MLRNASNHIIQVLYVYIIIYGVIYKLLVGNHFMVSLDAGLSARTLLSYCGRKFSYPVLKCNSPGRRFAISIQSSFASYINCRTNINSKCILGSHMICITYNPSIQTHKIHTKSLTLHASCQQEKNLLKCYIFIIRTYSNHQFVPSSMFFIIYYILRVEYYYILRRE